MIVSLNHSRFPLRIQRFRNLIQFMNTYSRLRESFGFGFVFFGVFIWYIHFGRLQNCWLRKSHHCVRVCLCVCECQHRHDEWMLFGVTLSENNASPCVVLFSPHNVMVIISRNAGRLHVRGRLALMLWFKVLGKYIFSSCVCVCMIYWSESFEISLVLSHSVAWIIRSCCWELRVGICLPSRSWHLPSINILLNVPDPMRTYHTVYVFSTAYGI